MKNNNEKPAFDTFRDLTKEQKRQNRRWFRKYVLKYKLGLINLVLVTIVLVGLASIIPFIMQIAIDEYLPRIEGIKDNQALEMIVILLVVAVVAVVTRSGVTWVATYFNRRFQQKIEMDLKKEVYQKCLRLKINFFDTKNEGFFIGLIMEDTNMSAEYARFIPENILNAFLSLTINFSFIFYYNTLVGVSGLVVIFCLIVLAFAQRKAFKETWRNIKVERDKFNTFFVNSVAGIREIKNFTNEKHWSQKYDQVSHSYQNAWKRQFGLMAKWMSSNTFVLGILPVTVIAISVWQLAIGNMEFGAFAALLTYSSMITQPINQILSLFDIYVRGSVSLNKIFSFIQQDEESYEGKKIQISRGTIEFQDVYLSYQNQKHALNGLSFKIKRGESVALVGKTGAGKSTVLKALLKHYKIKSGRILIDDQDLENVSVNSLRKQITYMSQDPFISYDTIEENIVFGNPEVKPKDVQQVIQKAQAQDFVAQQPAKEKTLLGPRGVTLSGGQKQRIALARTLIKKTNVLLLDEATSALDNKVESLIKQTLNKEMKNATTIIVAHRLTTVRDVDRIIVMNKGKIVEQGSWDQLIKQKGVFKDLVDSAQNDQI